MKKLVFNIFLILIVINLSSCLTGAFTDYWFDTNDVQETIEDDVEADLDETSTIGSSSTAGNPALILPPIAYVPDAENYYPVVGQAGAVSDFEDGDLLAVSSSEFDDALACVEPTAQGAGLKAQGEENGDRWSAGSLVRGIAGVAGSQGRRVAGKSSYGDVILNAVKDLVISTAHADVDTCEDDGTTTYCPISDDGSYECFASFDTESVSMLYVAVVDDTCTAVSDQEEVTVQANLHYLASAPTDIRLVDGTLYSVTDGNGVKLNVSESGAVTVDGEYDTDYQNFETTGSKLAHSSNDDLVGVLSETAGIQLFEKSGETITDAGETDTDENAISYTFIRDIDECIYFGYEQESSTEAHLMYATTDGAFDYTRHTTYYILNNNDQDGESNTIYHTKTLAYDTTIVSGDKYTVIGFIDENSNNRFRIIKNTGSYDGDRFDGDIWKTTEEANVKDIVTYYDDDDDDIYFAILDDTNSKLRLGSYSSVDTSPSRNLEDGEDHEVDVGDNPTAMYYSETSGKLYVLNQTGKSVSIISLMQDATNPYAFDSIPDVTTLDLDSYITDIDNLGITLVPNAITLETTSERLVISDTTTKGAIVVDVSTYETAL